MPRLTRIYTRKGDDGTTTLGTLRGARVPKDSRRVTAYGIVDELNSVIGVALAHGLNERLADALPSIQNDLLHLGADMSYTEDDKRTVAIPKIDSRHVQALETLIDELYEEVGPLENFILPGGCVGAALLQQARTICRRAEREVVTLAREEGIGEHLLPYLNRLSDALFMMARYENKRRGVAEPVWDTHT